MNGRDLTSRSGWGALGRALALTMILSGAARGQVFTGADWRAYFNLPDQDYDESPGEYVIRDALLEQLAALQAGHTGILATYTFSAEGTAGAILEAVENALNRGATVKFIADYTLNPALAYDGRSLAELAARAVNPLIMSRATNSNGVMHHKFGLFDNGRMNRWLLQGSWNFTSKASYGQWNAALALRNAELYAAFKREADELLAGRFHYQPAKSHAPNGSTFRLAGSWNGGWVDFAPYPSSSFGSSNAQTDICRLIQAAREEIVFALNKLNRPHVRDALVAAANRGVRVTGVIPQSDWATASDTSYDVVRFLGDPGNYTTTNMVRLLAAYSQADAADADAGELDLVHAKWMAIDPWGAAPVLIHGSANWTDAGLASTSANDENLLFLRHAELARLFYIHFKRITGAWQDRNDNWLDLAVSRAAPTLRCWITDTNTYLVEKTDRLRSGKWTTVIGPMSNYVGCLTLPAPVESGARYYRTRRILSP